MILAIWVPTYATLWRYYNYQWSLAIGERHSAKVCLETGKVLCDIKVMAIHYYTSVRSIKYITPIL